MECGVRCLWCLCRGHHAVLVGEGLTGNFVVVEGVSEEQLAALQEEAGALKRQLGEIRDILQESDVRELQKLGKWCVLLLWCCVFSACCSFC